MAPSWILKFNFILYTILSCFFGLCGDGLEDHSREEYLYDQMIMIGLSSIIAIAAAIKSAIKSCRNSQYFTRPRSHRISRYDCPRRTSIPCTEAAQGLLERMQALSPPPSKRAQLLPTDQDHYTSWLLIFLRQTQHPSALDVFHRIVDAVDTGRALAFFFDYDGTLSPIVADADRAYMADEMRSAVRDIASIFPTAIVTGRSREKVFQFVKLPQLYYAGSHGLDIVAPHNEMGVAEALFQPPEEYMVVLREVYMLLKERIQKVCGTSVDDNKYSMSVHFRNVNEEDWLHLAEIVVDVVSKYPQLLLSVGRKVIEIRLDLPRDKGTAVEYLMRAVGPENLHDLYTIYIGDDKSDEDAFRVVNKYCGLSILVSKTPKETIAACTLHDTHQVLEFLNMVVNSISRLT